MGSKVDGSKYAGKQGRGKARTRESKGDMKQRRTSVSFGRRHCCLTLASEAFR